MIIGVFKNKRKKLTKLSVFSKKKIVIEKIKEIGKIK